MGDADSKQPTHTLHAQSPDEGDLVLVGKDDVGVRVESFHLKSHSPVLRVMLLTFDCDSSEPVIRFPTVTGAHLLTLVLAMNGKVRKVPNSKIEEPLFEFCLAYEMIATGREILRGRTSSIGVLDVFSSFLWASRLNDPRTAARILLEGHTTERISARKFRLNAHAFDIDAADQLRPTWVYALCKAESVAAARNPGTNWYNALDWQVLACEFLKVLERF